MLGAGLGLGARTSDILNEGTELGIAASLRASYAFFESETQAARLGVELIPGLYDEDNTLGTAVVFEWQLF
jgi:hypothetical protein